MCVEWNEYVKYMCAHTHKHLYIEKEILYVYANRLKNVKMLLSLDVFHSAVLGPLSLLRLCRTPPRLLFISQSPQGSFLCPHTHPLPYIATYSTQVSTPEESLCCRWLPPFHFLSIEIST